MAAEALAILTASTRLVGLETCDPRWQLEQPRPERPFGLSERESPGQSERQPGLSPPEFRLMVAPAAQESRTEFGRDRDYRHGKD